MSDAAFKHAWSTPIFDHFDRNIAQQPELAALERGCRTSVQHQLLEQHSSSDGPFARVDRGAVAQLYPQVPARNGVQIAYFIMGHREFAHTTISRLLRVLWSPEHLFLVHLDLRTNATAVEDLRSRYRNTRNVHMWTERERRAVGWGAFSMVELLLHAIATALAVAPRLDFVINLSDADVALRTNGEIVGFLRGFRGRSFVATKFPSVDALRYHAHAHMRRSAWLECEGEGFLIANQTAASFFGATAEARRCCYGRSGPVVYAPQLSVLRRPSPPSRCSSFFHGSPWVILSSDAARWLVEDPFAIELARHMKFTCAEPPPPPRRCPPPPPCPHPHPRPPTATCSWR
jgi:hypothetical protein